MIKKAIQILKHHPIAVKYQAAYSQLPKDMRPNLYLCWQYSALLSYLNNAKHKAIADKIHRSKLYQHPFFLSVYAKSLFLQGKYKLATKYLERFLQIYPYYADAIYLKSEILVVQGNKQQAWQLLQDLTFHSRRKKTWQMLANLVDNKSDFNDYFSLFQAYFPSWKTDISYDLLDYLSTAAIRSGEMDFAVSLWQFCYEKKLVKLAPTPRRQKKYTNRLASQALIDFKSQMDAMNVSFFLISGTLLGCIRENALLRHDKDIDIGIWAQENLEQLIAKLRTSGYFYILPNHNSNIIVIRHVNSVTIDIFVHHRDVCSYWHAGGKSRWDNTPFELAYQSFLGDKYLIPRDYERYLTENYGVDWRIPKVDFDSALDTPNMQIVDKKAMMIYLYKKMFVLHFLDKKSSKRYLVALNQCKDTWREYEAKI